MQERPHRQKFIIPQMKKVGYPSNDKGVCVGLGTAWMIYGLSGHSEKFFNVLLKLIFDINKGKIIYEGKSNFSGILKLVQQKVKRNRIRKNKIREIEKEINQNNKEINLNEVNGEENQENKNILNEMDEFYKKIEIILDKKDPLLKKEKLTEFEQNILEINELYGAVEFIHNIEKYQPWIKDYIPKGGLEEIVKIFMPEEIIRRGGVEKVLSWTMFVDQKELNKFFKTLTEIFEEHHRFLENENINVVICLDSFWHRIGIEYLYDKKLWRVAESNKFLNDDESMIELPPKQMGEFLIYGFGDINETCFNIKVYTTKNNKYFDDLKGKLVAFGKKKLTNKQLGKTKSRWDKEEVKYGHITMAHVAAKEGDLEMLLKIKNTKPKILCAENGNDGVTPLAVAVQYREVRVIKWFSQHFKEAFLIQDGKDYTPFIFAVLLGDILTIKAIIKYGVKEAVCAKNSRGESGLEHVLNNNSQVRMGDENVYVLSLLVKKFPELLFEQLEEQGDMPIYHIQSSIILKEVIVINPEILNFKSKSGDTLAHIILQGEKVLPNFIRVLAEHKVNFEEKNKESVSALEVAIDKKNWRSVLFMLNSMENIPHFFNDKELENVKNNLEEETKTYLKKVLPENQVISFIEGLRNQSSALGKILMRDTFSPKQFQSISFESFLIKIEKKHSNQVDNKTLKNT